MVDSCVTSWCTHESASQHHQINSSTPVLTKLNPADVVVIPVKIVGLVEY